MKTITITETSENITFTLDENEIGTLEGWEYPSVRSVVEDISGSKSSVYVTSKFGRRRFSIQALVRQGLDDRRTMLKAMRQTGFLKLLKFKTLDDLELQAEVEILNLIYPYTKVQKPFLIEMVAPDWRFYSQTLVNTDSADTEQTISNSGNEKTYPVFKINGPFTSVSTANLTTGEDFTLVETILDGEYIEIDCFNRTVKDDDGNSVIGNFTGDFFGLVSGNNLLQFNPTGSGGNTSLETIYRHAYNGI